MDTQQLAAKVAQLETRVASLEDEGKIVKGEVKQVLTEIRSAVLSRENPFDNSLPSLAMPTPAVEQAVTQQPTPAPTATPPEATTAAEVSREPIPLRAPAAAIPAAATATAALPPRWTLLTISGLSAWAEDAMRRLGALRVEILLDLCEASGHLTAEARKALSRITEMELPEPQHAPSTNETAAILRELDALLSEGEEQPSIRLSRAA